MSLVTNCDNKKCYNYNELRFNNCSIGHDMSAPCCKKFTSGNDVVFRICKISYYGYLGILIVDGQEHSRNGTYCATAELALIKIMDHAKSCGFDV